MSENILSNDPADYDWAGEQKERAYWEVQVHLTLLYGPAIIPQEFYEFVQWLDETVSQKGENHERK